MRGLSLREVALEIEREFELIQTPPIGTVYDWIQAALREGMRSNEDAVRDYVMLFRARSEEIIRVLIPFVLHDFLVERTKTINGVPVKVIEERVLKQRAMAAAEIRKQGESVLRAMGVNRAPPVREKTRSEDMTLLVIHTINQQIAAERGVTAGHAEKVVELTGGEPDARLTSL